MFLSIIEISDGDLVGIKTFDTRITSIEIIYNEFRQMVLENEPNLTTEQLEECVNEERFSDEFGYYKIEIAHG